MSDIIKAEYEGFTERIAGLEDELTRLRDLAHRWNIAASHAGFAGSEYVDDPELVFRRVMEWREHERKLLRNALSPREPDALSALPRRRPDSKMLANLEPDPALSPPKTETGPPA